MSSATVHGCLRRGFATKQCVSEPRMEAPTADFPSKRVHRQFDDEPYYDPAAEPATTTTAPAAGDMPFVDYYSDNLAIDMEFDVKTCLEDLAERLDVTTGSLSTVECEHLEAILRQTVGEFLKNGRALEQAWHDHPYIIYGIIRRWIKIRKSKHLAEAMTVNEVFRRFDDLFKVLTGIPPAGHSMSVKHSMLGRLALLLRFIIAYRQLSTTVLMPESLLGFISLLEELSGRPLKRRGDLEEVASSPVIIVQVMEMDGFASFLGGVDVPENDVAGPVVMRLLAALLHATSTEWGRTRPPSPAMQAVILVDNEITPLEAGSSEFSPLMMAMSANTTMRVPDFDEISLGGARDWTKDEPHGSLLRKDNERYSDGASSSLHDAIPRCQSQINPHTAFLCLILMKLCDILRYKRRAIDPCIADWSTSRFSNLVSNADTATVDHLWRAIVRGVSENRLRHGHVMLALQFLGLPLFPLRDKLSPPLGRESAIRIAEQLLGNANLREVRELLGPLLISSSSQKIDQTFGTIYLQYIQSFTRERSKEMEDLIIGRKDSYSDGTMCERKTLTADDVDLGKLRVEVMHVLGLFEQVLRLVGQAPGNAQRRPPAGNGLKGASKDADSCLFLAKLFYLRATFYFEDRNFNQSERDLDMAFSLLSQHDTPPNHPDMLQYKAVQARLSLAKSDAILTAFIRERRKGRNSNKAHAMVDALHNANDLLLKAKSILPRINEEWHRLNKQAQMANVLQIMAKVCGKLGDIEILLEGPESVEKAKREWTSAIAYAKRSNDFGGNVYLSSHDCFQRNLFYIKLWEDRIQHGTLPALRLLQEPTYGLASFPSSTFESSSSTSTFESSGSTSTFESSSSTSHS